jgi:hypothetical protein
MKRVGPELKIPDLRSLQVPAVLRDLYEDLRDRRLLPLVGLILVAIVAVPFLLGGAAEEEVAPAVPPLEAGGPSTNTSLAVVPAAPGLRDYRKRLRHRSATDPFKPQYTGPVLEGTQLGGSPETSTTATTSTATTSTESSGSSGSTSAPSSETPSPSGSAGGSPSVPPGKGSGGDSEDEGGVTAEGELTFYTFALDVKITKTTTLPKSKPEVVQKDGILPPATLPGAKTEVITYIGVSPKTGKALFIVSEDVGSVFGDVECVAGSGRCQLLELEKGLPVTFLYGENDARYKVNVLDVETVATSNGEGSGRHGKPEHSADSP